jgi:hypothetical protein
MPTGKDRITERKICPSATLFTISPTFISLRLCMKHRAEACFFGSKPWDGSLYVVNHGNGSCTL